MDDTFTCIRCSGVGATDNGRWLYAWGLTAPGERIDTDSEDAVCLDCLTAEEAAKYRKSLDELAVIQEWEEN